MFGLAPFRNKNLPARDYVDQLLHGFLDDNLLTPLGNIINDFRMDLRETENEYVVEADLPGIKKDDISLRYENPYLTIYAKRDGVQEIKEENYVRKERRYGEFQRSIYVDNVMDDKIEAKFNEGVLTVTLPKQDKAKSRPGNIQIQ